MSVPASTLSPSRIRAYAHAKINLLLRILGRDIDGYHGIETLFQALELADTVDIELADNERTLHCDGPAMPAAGLGASADNLATRAAVAYCTATKWDTGWRIDIEKHIPVGGGLGGGSADAAAVLRALEHLSPAPLGSAALVELAGTLGADVAFCTSGASLAWAWGRGHRLLSFPSLPQMDVVLVTFDEGVPTGRAYAAFSTLRDSARDSATQTSAAAVGNPVAPALIYPLDAFGSWSSIVGLASNDFERVVPSMHDGVARWLPVLRQGASRLVAEGTPAIGQLSGSGATCFLLTAPGKAPRLSEMEGMRVVQTRTLPSIHSL